LRKSHEQNQKRSIHYVKTFCLCYYNRTLLGSGAYAQDAGKNSVVVIETSMGTVKIELFAKEAPLSVKNFLDYASSGFTAALSFTASSPTL